MKKIYIDKKAIERIKDGGPLEPCIVIREGEHVQHVSKCFVHGPCEFVHDHTATEGPTVWAETESGISVTV